MTLFRTKPSLRFSSTLLLMTSITLVACTSADATGNPTSLSSAPEDNVPVAVSTLSPTDIEGRLSSLENKVGSLEKDMTAAKPTLAKVEVIERQFRSLSLELDRIDQESLSGSAPALKPNQTAKVEPIKQDRPIATKPITAKHNIPKAQPTTGKAVTGVRFGSQSNSKTRIVVDGGAPVSMTADLDNQEKILVLEIKGLDWKTALSKSNISSPLITSYTAQNTDNGSRLVLQLKRAVRVGKVQSLGPEGSNGHRAFLDLTAQ